MQADRARRQRDDWIESRAGPVEQRLGLPLRHDPAVDVSRRARVQPFEHFPHGIPLVEFQSQLRT